VAVCALAITGGPADAGAALSLKPIEGTFPQPTFIAQAPGEPRLLFVTEKTGKIAVLRDGQPLSHPFLDMSSLVSSSGEQGLLSMAFDPNYAKNGRFYVYYTNHNCGGSGGGCNVEVDGFKLFADSRTSASFSSRAKVIEINHHQAGNHNGGQVAFGPEGDLYLAVGDGGTQQDPENDAQNPANFLGKVLRVDPRPGGGYDSPPDNPYVGVPGRNAIFAIGLRNPYRFSFDSQNGDLWIGDVGDNTREEIDQATPAQANGANFGWHYFEGSQPCADCGFGPGTDPPPHYVPPVHDYTHSGSGETGNVIIGGYVVHDPKLPSLDGKYVYTDNGAGDLRSFNPANGHEQSLGLDVNLPSSFGEGLNGSIYVASLGDNKVYKLVDQPAARRPAHRRSGVRLAKLGNFDTPDYVASAPGVRGWTYVVQRGGKVIAVRHGKRRTFLNLTSRTTTDGERGLLSIAFDPNYQRNRLVYAFYTNPKGDVEVDSFRAPSNRRARRSSRRKVISVRHRAASNHNGGTIQFGPGRDLYIGIGDGGDEGDPHGHGQNKRVLLGKLLRIKPQRRGKRHYTVPPSNPFVGRPGRDEIYALGLRNPFRFSFDNRTGHIAIGDVGQDSWEEVDYESRQSLRGANFGWNHFEGDHVYDSSTRRPKHHYEPPIHEYSHAHGCAVIGGYVIRDPKLRALRGRYVYDDLCSGQLRSLVPHNKHATGDHKLGLSVPDPGGFGLAHGHVYVASLDGPVYRLAPRKH